jgi:hypothetical protein
MGKDLYTLKLKNLSEQINLMLMEAGMDDMSGIATPTAAPGTSDVTAIVEYEAQKDFEAMKSYLGGKSAEKQSRDYFSKVSGFTDKMKKHMDIAQKNMPSANEIQRGIEGETSGIQAVILTGTGIIVSALGALNIFAKGLDEVKKLTNLALNSNNYQDFTKYTNALKKIASDTSLWSKLTVSSAAREAAGANMAMIKKGYISAGVAMILVSLILVILAGIKLEFISSIKEAVKELDVKSILSALAKLLGLGALILPAILGVCIIVLAMGGFNDAGIASKVAGACYPVLKVVNIIVAKVIEVSQNAARNKVSSIKKMKALKK